MRDHLQKRGSPHCRLVALGEHQEVRCWTQRLNVGEEALRRAVEQVGSSAAEVEKRLRPN